LVRLRCSRCRCYQCLVLPGLQTATHLGKGCYGWDENGTWVETTSRLAQMLNSPHHLAQILAAGDKARYSEESRKKGGESRKRWWDKDQNKTHMKGVRIDQWARKKAKEAAEKERLSKAERAVQDLRERVFQNPARGKPWRPSHIQSKWDPPRRPQGDRRERNRLAQLQTYILKHASRARNGCQGSARIAQACGR
jgi:hypothetical protein